MPTDSQSHTTRHLATDLKKNFKRQQGANSACRSH